MPPTFDLADARALVRLAHAGQADKQGRDYVEAHLEPIAVRLRPHGDHAEMAGLLHDIVEDTDETTDSLRARGVPAEVVAAVDAVSRRSGEDYADLIERAGADPLGRLVKLADNAHNLGGLDDLARTDPQTAARLRDKYETARATLLSTEPGAGESR